MKKVNVLLSWVFLSLVLTGSLCAGPAGASGEPAPVPQAVQTSQPQPAASSAEPTEILNPLDFALLACSPPPQCWSNADCDRICGPGLGTCVRVNSCYRACACAAAAMPAF